jgi:hypothetical protein
VEELLYAVDEMVRTKVDFLERMGQLLNFYKKKKVQMKEEKFTLFDLANHIYNEITVQTDNDLMFYLIAKFKKHQNRKFGRPLNFEIDPRKDFEIKELDSIFEYICTKNQTEIHIISSFLDK